MTGACSRELAQSLHHGLPPGTIPSGLLVANAAKAESLEDLVREVDLVHRSPVVFTVSQPQRFPQLLTASPSEGFAKWTAPTGREPSGQFLMEFDRVICVPGQGVGLHRPCETYEGQPWHRHPVHVRMLQRGLGLLGPGGRLVFVALAQHPVENEAVIAAALSRYGPSVQIEDARWELACPSSSGCTSWSIPNPNTGEEPSHFLSWDDVPPKLRGGKVLRTMFPPRHSEPNGLELGSQLARCLRLGVGPGLFLAVLVKDSTAPRICSSPCPVEEDEQSAFPPGSNIMVRASGAFARVVGRGSGPYAGLVKIRYPDRSTYHLEASELQPLLHRPAASPAFTSAFKLACLAVTTMSTLFCISRSRRPHTIFHRLKWHSGALLSACLAFACMRSRRHGVGSPVVVDKSPIPGSRIVRGCANVPQPVQSFCSFFGWDLCWEKFRDCLAYRTADKRDLYLVSAAVFQLRVPEQLRQALCGMPVLTRCDVLEKRYWGTGDLKPRSTLTAFLRKHASRRRLFFQGALLQEILDAGRLSLQKACALESQGQLEGLDSCTSAGILQPGCVLVLRSGADDTENSECWLGVLGSRHLEIPEVLHGASSYSRSSRSTQCLACDMALVARRITRPGWTWTFPLQQVRWCSAGSSSDVLTASAATDVARLGGAIAARLRQVGSASIRSFAIHAVCKLCFCFLSAGLPHFVASVACFLLRLHRSKSCVP
ncbi:NCL1 [Symbiodinium sp. CCMP2456]|nr:NCL1 [Symbiodinium sp. CCMP2456]